MKKILKNYLFFFISIFVGLLIVEIFLKFYKFPLSGVWRIQDNDGMYLNKSSGQSKHQYFKGKDFVDVKYNFGEHHNRLYKDFSLQNSNNVLVLGDSFTFGWLLDDENTFIYKLQDNFLDKYFINSAAGGWGFDDYARFLKNYCEEIKPKKTIIFISNVSNDLRDSKYSNLYILENKKLIESKNEINNFKKFLNQSSLYQFVLENISIFQLLRSFYVTYYHYFLELKADRDIENHEKKIISENKKKLDNEAIDKLYINLIFSEIIKNAKKCNSDLNVINLAWDNDPRNKLSDKLSGKNKKEIKLFDFFEENEYLWNNKSNLTLEEGHPNALANEYFYQKTKPIIEEIFSIK